MCFFLFLGLARNNLLDGFIYGPSPVCFFSFFFFPSAFRAAWERRAYNARHPAFPSQQTYLSECCCCFIFLDAIIFWLCVGVVERVAMLYQKGDYIQGIILYILVYQRNKKIYLASLRLDWFFYLFFFCVCGLFPPPHSTSSQRPPLPPLCDSLPSVPHLTLHIIDLFAIY